MFASDQNVFQDCDKEKKWLMMDKEGSLFSNPTYTLENFNRPVDANGKVSKRGQCLCKAKLKVVEARTYGHDTHEDSDSSEDDSEAGVDVDTQVTRMKWAQQIKVEFFNDREQKDHIATVKVKAKGKAKRTEITTTTTDAEGNESTSTRFDIDKKIKKVKYTITEMKGLSHDQIPKINLQGKPNKSAYKLKWDCSVFQAEIDSSGWGSQEIIVDTSYTNPNLGMLMGYVIAKEISPDDILGRISVF